MNKRIDINILTKNRETYLYGLLLSLKYQTEQNFDVYILDDGSTNPVMNNHFIQCIIQRLRFEGHRVDVIRNNNSENNIAKARQQLADYCIKEGVGDYICRLDDDTFLEVDYLESLIEVIDEGYDLASGVTPPVLNPMLYRENKFVKPIINRVVLDDKGQFLVNCDDCGHSFEDKEILPTHHFRSAALYKKEIHEKVKYEDNLAQSGFREEEFFSFRMILNGYKLGVNTFAIMWHCIAPSGGDRKSDYNNHALTNQKMLNKFTQRAFEQRGNFIEKYNKEVLKEDDYNQLESLNKNTNLIYTREI